MQKKQKVDFIGVGTAKTGTSWIYKSLEEHPEVCVSSKKEIHFFNKYHGDHLENQTWNYKKGIDWYLKHFSHCDSKKVKGEMDTRYLFEKQALELIKKHFPNVKIIVTLRNPIERTFSNYLYHIQKTPGFRKKAPTLREGIKYNKDFINDSIYYPHVKNCLNIFSEKQVLILFYKKLKDNPKKFIKRVFKFLNVENSFSPSTLDKKVNKTKKLPGWYTKLRNLKDKIIPDYIDRKKNSFKIYNLIKENLDERFKNNKKPKLKEKDKKFLKNKFLSDIQKLENLLNINLDSWKKI